MPALQKHVAGAEIETGGADDAVRRGAASLTSTLSPARSVSSWMHDRVGAVAEPARR